MRIGRKKLIFIVGPTATGKTCLAIKLADRLHGEIISADSMQIYKGMSVISQAPTSLQRKTVKHHLVNLLNPERESNAASFRAMAIRAIKTVIKKKKMPIIVGGSGLYIKALIDGLFPSPEADMAYREKLYRYTARHGSAELHARLAKIDPVSSGRIHPNDTRRIIRALEIYHLTGRTMTDLAAETKGLEDEYDIFIFGLNKPRKKLYSGIDERVERIFRDGAVKEVERLSDKKPSRTAAAALGFTEISGYLSGRYGLDEAKAMLAKNTRNFAKRQLTWFRADKRIKWFDVSRASETEIIRKIIKVTRAQSHRNLRGVKGEGMGKTDGIAATVIFLLSSLMLQDLYVTLRQRPIKSW